MTPPPGGQDSWAWLTRSPSPYTTVSSKPNASTRKRIRARASRARSVGQTWGGGLLSVMIASLPPGWPGAGLDVSELLRQPGRRRAAGQRAELAGQVGLVVVAALGGQAGQAGPACAGGGLPLQEPAGPVEPGHPGGGLRGQPGLGQQPPLQVARAPAGLARRVRRPGPGRRCAPAAARPRRCPGAPAGPGRPGPAAPGPGWRTGRASRRPRASARAARPRPAPSTSAAVQVPARQLAGGQAEQGPRAQRAERDLDAGLPPGVGDQRGRGVQPADQGAVVSRAGRPDRGAGPR